jgi:hypothetical protein
MVKGKIEIWKKTLWKGTKREQTTTEKVYVIREKGKIKKVYRNINQRMYYDGFYDVILDENKNIVFKVKTGENPFKKPDYNFKQDIFRTSYVLNNVPISKDGYFGFRIVAFSVDDVYLKNLRDKLKAKLKQWISDCIHYHESEFWFDMYFGYEQPQLSNATITDDGTYELTKEDRFGRVTDSKSGRLENL